MFNWQQIQADLLAGASLTQEQARALADYPDTAALAAVAGPVRDRGFRNVITYSRKVFIPLTQLCRDVCHYCTFAQTPKKIGQPFMSVEQVLDICHQGARQDGDRTRCQRPAPLARMVPVALQVHQVVG